MLGFVGAPFTLASYIVEGGSSKNYTHIKRLAFGDPDTLHALLSKLAENIATYVRYQVCTFKLWRGEARAVAGCGWLTAVSTSAGAVKLGRPPMKADEMPLAHILQQSPEVW